MGSPGEVWNGLVSVDEKPEDVNEVTRYIDGIKFHQHKNRGYFSGTIECYNYPESFHTNVFTQRRMNIFGLSYRTETAGNYKIHLVYNVMLAPSAHVYDQTEIVIFRWPFTSLPVMVAGVARTAHLVVDTSEAYSSAISELEDILYGTTVTSARLPLPEEILAIFESHAILKVTDNGDGSFTVTGPDSAIVMLDATTFEITWPSAIPIDSDSYTISSL